MTHDQKWVSRRGFCERMFSKAANGNQAAYAFLFTLFDAIGVADDIHDKDVEISQGATAKLCYLMASLLANPFCRLHGDALAGLMTTSVIAWDRSNVMDDAKDYSKRIEQVVFYVAAICGGYELAQELSTEWITESR